MKLISILCICLSTLLTGADKDWVKLFNGKDLNGWQVKENEYASRRLDKKAITAFSVKDNAITVTSPYRSKGKFLVSAKSYSSFVLELEFKVPLTKSNSFIGYHGQFAKISHKQRKNQFNDLHSFSFPFGVWPKSTGIGEVRYKGSKSLLPEDQTVKSSLKPGTWHKARIEVTENSIKHWIDDQQTVNLTDLKGAIANISKKEHAQKMSGFIVLGMNDHPKGVKETLEICWRNIRIKELSK